MPHSHHASVGVSLSVSAIDVVLVVAFGLYVHGRRRMQGASVRASGGWRSASFVGGLLLVWAALGSPLVAYEHDLLTVHMIQHLLLMSVAPALILLGEPLLALWHGLPRLRVVLRRVLQQPLIRRFARTLTQPAVCWTVSALTLVAWHVPTLLTAALRSQPWHMVEQSSFLVAGFLFWSPVVHPWPSGSTGPRWSNIVYLFLATLPCDILSGFLVFSERIAYPAYASMPRHFGLTVLDDQQFAAALMWASVTVIYLVPAAILSVRLLAPQNVSSSQALEAA